jgi:hypothetical protein
MPPAAIFLDWDDTLLCSTFVSNEGLKAEASFSPFQNQFRDLESAVIAMLNLAKSLGDVYIVTNAEIGWVELSAKRFLPGVIPLLQNIRIYSARSTFEKEFPNAPLAWKFNMFRFILEQYGIDTPRNVISFGDSNVEREAIRQITKAGLNCCLKSIKFAERPSLEQLKRQIELVATCLHEVVAHPGELDLALTISVPPGQ